MTTQAVLSKTLGNIQRIDPCANKVLMKATHTALYTFQTDKKGWVKTDVDGAFFIYQRCDRPYYSVLIANRQSLSDFIEPIIDQTCVQVNGHYLYMKKSDGKSAQGDIKCIWFYKDDECLEVHNMIEDLVNNLKLGNIPTVEEAKQSSPVMETTSDSNNLLELLKAAQRKPNERPPSSNNKVEEKTSVSQNITEMPTLLQKLMVQEQQQMFSQPVPSNAMMSADELEKDLVKDLLTTAKPKLNIADMANSSSAISLANFSTRSIHGSEYGDAAEIESVVSTRVQAEDPAADEGSGSETSHTTPALNKDQFLAGLSHLLENDDTFVAQIHQAYVEALNRRLNLDSHN